jgi:tRNA A-37 threonylcarbamoyl transferase component Bud32
MRKIYSSSMSETFDLNDNRILKLFKPEYNAFAEKESKLVMEIGYTGIPVPDVLDVIELEGRYGIVFRKVKGRSMKELVWAKPWTYSNNAKLLAKLHRHIHKVVAPNLPSHRKFLIGRIQSSPWFSSEFKRKVLQKLKQLPDGDSLCHCDFNLYNILVSPNEATILDWGSAKQGNPLADVAETSLCIRTGLLPKNRFNKAILSIARNKFSNIYLSHYFKHHPELKQQFNDWLVPVAASFFFDGPLSNFRKDRMMELNKIFRVLNETASPLIFRFSE